MPIITTQKYDGAPTIGVFSVGSTYRAELGESPVWDPKSQSVWWVDCQARMLVNTEVDGTTRTWPTPEIIGFVALAFDKVIVGLETGLFNFDPQSEEFEKKFDLDNPEIRFNDATVGAGYLWASTMDRGVEQPNGSVLRIDSDFNAHKCLDGFRRANGLAIDAKHLKLYVSDSHPERADIAVATLDAKTHSVLRVDPFCAYGTRPGRPDGAALDPQGNYWIARVDAGLVDVLSPDGRLLSGLSVPVPEPTKICFGGADMRTLFLTSKRTGPLGGKLLAAQLETTL